MKKQDKGKFFAQDDLDESSVDPYHESFRNSRDQDYDPADAS